jgi:ribosomal protein S18 acetylase RimI-like enzyme
VKNFTVGRGRTVRVGPWRGDETVATIATFIDQRLDAPSVGQILDRLTTQGYQRAITAALAVREHDAFAANGFEPLRHLTLLRRSLDDPVARTPERMRRWRRRRFEPVLAVDHAAFEPFWRFDETALREALEATPHRLLRVDSLTEPTGYALSGVARNSAYLQRLAVHPDAAGHGVGSTLLLDALRWMRFRGADEAFVNTQDDNERALALYRRHGFEPEPEGLTIFERDL